MSERKGNERETAVVDGINSILYTENITRHELAEQCQGLGYPVSQSSISKILAGKQHLTVEQLYIFSRVLEVPIESLITVEQDNSDKPFNDINLPRFSQFKIYMLILIHSKVMRVNIRFIFLLSGIKLIYSKINEFYTKDA